MLCHTKCFALPKPTISLLQIFAFENAVALKIHLPVWMQNTHYAKTLGLNENIAPNLSKFLLSREL